MHNTLSERATILGFDFGLKRIGVAVGQLLTATATPLNIVNAEHGRPDWKALDKLMEDWRPSALVVGIPLNMDGTLQPISQQAQEFAKKLQQHYNLPVYTADERLTTREAREQIFSKGGYRALTKQRADSVAAQIILQSWLEDNISSINNPTKFSPDQNTE